MTDAVPSAADVDAHPISAAIVLLARNQRALAAELLGPLGLFPGQELLLGQLWAQDGASQKELAERLRVDHSTIAKSIARLERTGLVARSRSASDGRVTLVHLTPEGRRIEAAVREAWDELESRIAQGMSAEHREAFIASSARVARTIEATGTEGGRPTIADPAVGGHSSAPPGA